MPWPWTAFSTLQLTSMQNMENSASQIETFVNLCYIDSLGQAAIAVKPISYKIRDGYVVYTYSKTLAKNTPSPADTEEEAMCQLLNSLSRDITEHEHVIEYLKKVKKAVSEDLI